MYGGSSEVLHRREVVSSKSASIVSGPFRRYTSLSCVVSSSICLSWGYLLVVKEDTKVEARSMKKPEGLSLEGHTGKRVTLSCLVPYLDMDFEDVTHVSNTPPPTRKA